MRRLLTIALAAMASGCVGPHSDGSLWARQMMDRERTLFQLNDAQRAQLAHTVELGLADEVLSAEQTRVTALLQTCPGPQHTLTSSPGDTLRDGLRLRAQGDATRLAQVASVGLADWFERRAAETQDRALCDRARAALSGQAEQAEPGASQLLNRVPDATVTRDPSQLAPDLDTDPPMLALSNYALGQVSSVHAAAPLPQYLALVYGGALTLPSNARPSLDVATAAQLVDREAASFRDWEPDALYAALRNGQP